MFLAVVTACTSPRLLAEPSTSGPLSPTESLTQFQLAPGLEIHVAAAEPAVIDPVAVRFDEAGRMWVVEMRDYPHGPEDGEEPRSRIKILEDRDGDGRFETAQIFADKLLFVTGLQPWQGGVIVTLAGQVAYLKDTNGDGQADVNETWYAGFAEQNSQLRANHPRFGWDNHVYIANGLRGGTVIDPRREDCKPVSLSGKDFRFNPHTFRFEAITGTGQFGLTFDDFGNRYVCSNRNPLVQVVLEEQYIQRNPGFAPARAVHDVAAAGAASRLYPISRAWTTSNLHAGQFTAACGVFLYRGDALPSGFYGNAFTCDPTGNLVHREVLQPAGAVFRSRAARQGIEFLASPDEWFRPVNLASGPDGALYVVDMYRAVIEHPQWMPNELKTRPDLLLGNDRGRIYRISSAHATQQPRTPSDAEEAAAWASWLRHPNGWHRDTAARVLYERRAASVAPQLADTALEAPLAASRIQALCTLDGLGQLQPGLLSAALGDQDAGVRRLALLLAGKRLDESAELQHTVWALAEDPDMHVRFTLALVLAPADDVRSVDALAKVARQGVTDIWLRDALAIAASERVTELLAALMHDPAWSGRAPRNDEIDLIRTLVGLAFQRGDRDALTVLRQLLALRGADTVPLQRAGLLAAGRALRRRRSSLAALAAAKGDRRIEQQLQEVFAAAAELAGARSAAPAARNAAVQLLAHDHHAEAQLESLALSEVDQGVRLTAIAAMVNLESSAEFWTELFGQYRQELPRVRRAIAAAALSRASTTELFLDAIAAGRIQPAELDRAEVNRLLQHQDAGTKTRAAQLLADAIPADRQQVLADYQVALRLQPDASRGRQVFAKHCAACHRIGDLGVNVAPDISDSRTKQPAQLLTDILQPNRAIDSNYVSYSVVTQDGLSLTGIIVTETATSVTLKQLEGKTATLLRSDIELLRSNGVSLMPAGLEKDIPPQAMADLIFYIKNWRYLDGRTPLGAVTEGETP